MQIFARGLSAAPWWMASEQVTPERASMRP